MNSGSYLRLSRRFLCLSRPLQWRISGIRLGGSSFRCQTSLAASTSNATTPQGESVCRPFEEIPGPRGVPFFGNFFSYVTRKQLFVVEQEFFAKYGSIFKENIFGKDIVHISDLEGVNKVLRSEGKYPNRPALESSIDAREEKNQPIGIAQMQGAEWQRLRQAISPKMLRPKDLHANIPNFNSVGKDAMDRLVTVMGTHGHEGEVPDLQGELFKWSTESIGCFVFDARLGLYCDPPTQDVLEYIQAVNDFFTYTQKLEFGYEKMFRNFKMDSSSMRKLRHAMDIMTDTGMKHINEQMERLSGRENTDDEQVVPLLTYLLTKESLSPDEAVMTAVDMLAGGVDTTGTTMLWILYNLARNPQAQDQLFAEVDGVLGAEGYCTEKELNKIPYLKACLKETMRLTPVANANARILSDDIELLGYNVPAKTLIQMSTYSIGRSEKYFRDPLAFKPDRWLRENQESDAVSREFFKLPFGFGPRMCLGRRVAELEIYLFLAKIIQRFRLEYHHEPVEPVLRLISCPDRPVRIKFVKRD